ncbi:hypothetical protein [uncultured Actinobacillus sp.]|uniref:hypothetical protein n=1 Tax=uncultured Actinobacillus sp. TaxID=417616 RepID=UPI0025E26960|nr:hypothetical protein [uncultured Actinobacillus sp.]
MAINKDSILEMINNINLSAINDVNLFPELENFANELMNSSNPQHRFTALKINNRLQENPHYQTYLKSDVIEKEIKEEAKEKQYFKAVYQNKEVNAYQNLQTKKQEEKQNKENSLKENSSYQHNYLLYDKLFNQFGMSWNDLSHQEKQNFKIGIEKFSEFVENEKLFPNLNNQDKEEAKNTQAEIQSAAIANQHNKLSDEEFKKKIEELQQKLFNTLTKYKDISKIQDLEEISQIRKEYSELIDNNPSLNDGQKKMMKENWALETDAVQHLYSISQSVKNQEKINPEHITYMLGALHLENPSLSTIEVIKTLFNENQAVLDEIMKDPSLKEKFITELTNGGNKVKNLQSILDNHPEIKDKLGEYGIDIDEEIIKSQKKYGTNIDNKENSSSTPKEYIDEVTNHGELSSTIDQHPNVGEKFNPSESNVDNNDNKVSFKLG